MRTSLRPSSNVGQAPSLSNTKSKQAGSLSYIMASLTIVLSLTACAPQQQKPAAPQDKPLAAYQTNLLQTAFDVATAIPVNPHIKDRSKAQYKAVSACLELDQPIRALRYANKIGNWRRGKAYADYAFYSVQHGFTNDIPHYLDLAQQISTLATQDWRRDRIKVRIAQTHLLLGQTRQAAQFSASLEDSESGKVERVAATLCTDDDFAAQFKQLDGYIASQNFDLTKNTLYAFTDLFDRFYSNTDRRSQVKEKIKSSWKPMPVFIRIDLLTKLADISLKHADPTNALELVDEAQEIMDSVQWPAEYRIPQVARLAALRFRAGDQEKAHSSMAELLTFYNDHQTDILDIDRADTLIPVAETFQAMGDSAGALKVYTQAVEASVENPNSRPQAIDLSAICLSMALHQVAPDEALWSRIREIQAHLGDPW